MDNNVQFLFSVAREIMRSFESPVILLTMKDYADCIFNSLVDMHMALLQSAKPEQIYEIVNTFHFKWFQAVQDIENFKKRVNDTPREAILKAIDYTIEQVQKRHEYTKIFIKNSAKQFKSTIAISDRTLLRSNLDIIKDMANIVKFALIEKKTCLRVTVDRVDFYMIVSDEAEELMNWLDKLNDYLIIYFSKVIDLKIPNIASDLTKTLQRITNGVANITTSEAQNVKEDFVLKSSRLGSITPIVNTENDAKISAISENIQQLERQIEQLNQKSTATIALEHKAVYLQDRLQSLENLRVSADLLRNKEQILINQSLEFDDYDTHIFNHLLPHEQRCRLVEDLVKLWEIAIKGERKSIISILSATDIKEVFSDELGNFSIDKYGRKIYKQPGDDDLYQLNENLELVLMEDDDKHVYFYDECGRYYLDNNRMRVYQAYARTSEYMLDRGAVMVKLREVVDGMEYHYDHLGRYSVNENGTRIYRDKDSEDEYVSDGLGNLVRLHIAESEYKYCPVDPIQTASSSYLKEQVGDALKTCLVQVILAQPLDPIKNLADRLEKYYSNKQDKQIRLLDQTAMFAECKRDEFTKASGNVPSSLHEEQSTLDLNFRNYESKINDN